MNPAIGAFVGVSKQTEMLLMTVLALWVNIFDMAIFEISSNLDQVWNVEIDKEIFNPNAEYVIRMLLSGVVLVRTFTLHLYIAFLIAVFWPVCFGTRPTLMLPWLVVSAIKNLGTGLVSIGTGGYTCMIYGPLRPACLRFLLSQLIDLSPSFYMWFVGLSLYCDLKKPKSVNKLQVKAMEDQELNVALRRRKVKSMIDEDILRQQFESRSFQKKFLGTSAVEVNEFINRCSYDNLKNKFSRSLDSLLDVLTVQTELLDIEDSEPLDIDSSSTLQQKTAKLLGISMDEIDCIKQNRQTRTDFPVYGVQPQKKTQTISTINSRYESPAKLLPETSLYSPPIIKPIRVTKSELKSAKDFFKIESEFMQSVPEKEVQVHDLTEKESFESLTNMQMMYQANKSLYKLDTNVTFDLESTNLSSKKTSDTKEHGKVYINKNRDKYSRKQDRGKIEDVQIETPNKYKFFNTMSDKSHYLLDEHCFLFDKESMLTKKEPSQVVSVYAKRKRSNDQNQFEAKQKRFNAPTVDVETKTRIKENEIDMRPPTFDGKSENKSNIAYLRKTKEDATNKNILKQSEKKKIISKKMPSSNYSNIPVLRRNIKSKNAYLNSDKNKTATNKRENCVNQKHKSSISDINKTSHIKENENNESVNIGENEKNNVSVNTEENILIINDKEKKTKTELKFNNKNISLEEEKKSSLILNQVETIKTKNTSLEKEKKSKLTSNEQEKSASFVVYQNDKNNNKNISLKEEKRNKFIINEEDKNYNKNILLKEEKKNKEAKVRNKHIVLKEDEKNKSTINKEEKNNTKNTLLKEEITNASEGSKISVSAEIERINQKNLNVSSGKKNDDSKIVESIDKTSAINKTEIINKRNYVRSMENGIPVPFLSIKHSPIRMTQPQKEAIKQEQKLLPKEDNKHNPKIKTSQILSEKLLQIIKEKNKAKAEKVSVEDIFKEKVKKTESVNNTEFEFTAKIEEKNVCIPIKTSSRNKQLEFHFKEKITKIKDNKMEDLFKKKVVAEKKESKTNVKEKVGFPSYFSNKINRMITDACQIRKKSCKKINLFIKVPTNTSLKQRTKISTVELFRKQSPPKINLFDTAEKVPIGKLEIPPYKGDKPKDRATNLNKNKHISHRIEINLFNTDEVKHKKSPEKVLISQKPSTKSITKSKTSVHSNNKTINGTNEVQSITKEKNNCSDDTRNTDSLINSFMSFKSSVTCNEENSCTSSKLKQDMLNVNEPKLSVSKTKSALMINTDTNEAQFCNSSANKDIDDVAKYIKSTESPHRINLFNQKSNTSTAAQKNSLPTIPENKNCKKLSEQAMNKIMSIIKTYYSFKATNNCPNAAVKNSSCKRLSEQAINKIISLTNTGYSNMLNRELKTATDSKLNDSVVQKNSNCKKLSDFAIDKLLAITSQKCPSNVSTTDKTQTFIEFTKTETEKEEKIIEDKSVLLGIPKNVSRSKNSSNTIDDKINKCFKEDLNDFNKKTLIEKTNSLHLELDSPLNYPKDSKTKINRKRSFPVTKEDITICQRSPNTIYKRCSGSASDMKLNTSHLIALVEEGAINTKPVINFNDPAKENSKDISAHTSFKNIFLNNSNPNIPSITVEETNFSSNERMFSAKEQQNMSVPKIDKNCKWMCQDCIDFFVSNTHPKEIILTTEANQNLSKIKDEKNYDKSLQRNNKNNSSSKSESPRNSISSRTDMSAKERIINNLATEEENECKEIKCDSLSHSNTIQEKVKHCINLVNVVKSERSNKFNSQCEEKIKETAPINKEENITNETLKNSSKLVSSNISESVDEKIPQIDPNVLVINKNEIHCKTNTSETNICTPKDEKNCKKNPQNRNNEYETNIPLVKIEKECKGTSQHSIKLISSTNLNNEKKPNKFDEIVNTKNTKVIKIKHEHEEYLQNNNILLSSLIYQTAYNSDLPIKEEKICRGTSQHNIKLVSSIKHESSSETNLFRNEKVPFRTKDDLYIPLKEQKVCRGSSQNYIKLIALSKDEYANNLNYSHKEALSNILKEYQTNPIMKEEKICKGTSKHKIKLVSSYKKDSPNKINLFHTETEYKSNKNENITIIKEEKICEGTLQHSIKLISSSQSDSPNKTIFIVKEQLPKGKETISTTKEDNMQKSSITNRPSMHTNLFVNVNTVNGKQNFTVIQKQKDEKESAQCSAKHEVNLFVKDQKINTDETKMNKIEENNLEEDNNVETFRKITLISNTIQNFLESDAEKLIEKTLKKKDTDLKPTNKESNVNPLVEIKSSEILSSLINKVENSIKLQESNKGDLFDETPDEVDKSKCPNYHNNQIDFSCQTSTLSKKILDNNPNEVTKKLSRTKSITKSISAKSYQDLNLQKLAFAMSGNKNSNPKLETKSNNENFSKEKDNPIALSSRSSRNASYVSIHKERLEKAKSSESDLNKSGILQNCAFLEDGYTRLYNLLGVKQENYDIKARRKLDSSFNF